MYSLHSISKIYTAVTPCFSRYPHLRHNVKGDTANVETWFFSDELQSLLTTAPCTKKLLSVFVNVCRFRRHMDSTSSQQTVSLINFRLSGNSGIRSYIDSLFTDKSNSFYPSSPLLFIHCKQSESIRSGSAPDFASFGQRVFIAAHIFMDWTWFPSESKQPLWAGHDSEKLCQCSLEQLLQRKPLLRPGT